MRKAVFVIGSCEYGGKPLTEQTFDLLDDIARAAGLDVELVFVMPDPWDAGKPKPQLGIQRIREERGRVLDEISTVRPDMIFCFGPVASACIWNRGNLVESELLRQTHYPLKDEGWDVPVYTTFSLENLGARAGIAKWLRLDVLAAANGLTQTEWGDYEILEPKTGSWYDGYVFLDKDCTAIGYDLETYPGLDPWHPEARIRMAVISDQPGRAWIVQATPDSVFPQWVYDLIEDPAIVKAGSNIAFDDLWMRRFGHSIHNMWDTSSMEHILDGSNPYKDLKSLTFKYLPRLGDYSKAHRDLVRERGGWEFVEDDEMYQYAGADGEASIAAYIGQAKSIADAGLTRPARLYRDLYPALCEMQYNGLHVDMTVNQNLDKTYTKRLAGLRKTIAQTLGPINLNSPAQLAKALQANIRGINLTQKQWQEATAGEFDPTNVEISTKRKILERESHKHPVIGQVLRYRKLEKRHNTFIEKVREKYAVQHYTDTGVKAWFIHPNFNTSIVETYRLSSSNPNGQNIPRASEDDVGMSVKSQFTSRFHDGKILEADLSQIELRFAAWASNDTAMRQAVLSGEDLHTALAAKMLGKAVGDVSEAERQRCKSLNFLILYGGGAKLLSELLKVPIKQAHKFIREYFEAFPELQMYIQSIHDTVKRDLQVQTHFGFRRRFVMPPNWTGKKGWHVLRQAFNTIIQNGAACLTYCAMIDLHNRLQNNAYRSRMILQVHDSIILDLHPEEIGAIIHETQLAMEKGSIMEAKKYAGITFDLPLQCDIKIGPSWGNVEAIT